MCARRWRTLLPLVFKLSDGTKFSFSKFWTYKSHLVLLFWCKVEKIFSNGRQAPRNLAVNHYVAFSLLGTWRVQDLFQRNGTQLPMSRTIVHLQWMEFSARLVPAISGWHRQPRRRLSLPMENWGKRTHQTRDGVSPMLSGDGGKFTVPRDEKFMYRLELNAILDKPFSRWHWWKIWWLQIRLEDRVTTTTAYFVASLSSLLQGNRRELSVSRKPPKLQRMECTRVGFSCLDLTIPRWHWQSWWRMPLSVVPGVHLL